MNTLEAQIENLEKQHQWQQLIDLLKPKVAQGH